MLEDISHNLSDYSLKLKQVLLYLCEVDIDMPWVRMHMIVFAG